MSFIQGMQKDRVSLGVSQAPKPKQTGGSDWAAIMKAIENLGQNKLLAQLAQVLMLRSASQIGNQPPSGRTSPQSAAAELKPLQKPIPAPMTRPVYAPANPAPVSKAKATPVSTANQVKGRQEIDELINNAARRHNLDPNLVKAVVTAESDFNPNCVSHAGAQGLMQLMPETAIDLGVDNPFDPRQNIEGGTRYLAMMLKRFDGDLDKALSAYNWGPSNVEGGGKPPLETRNYLKKVNRFKELYAKGFSVTA